MSQRGHLRLEGRVWRLQVRQAPAPGEPRRRLSVRLGTRDELRTRAAARRAADRYLDQHDPRPLNAASVVTWGKSLDSYAAGPMTLHGSGTRASQASILERHLRPAFPESRPIHTLEPADWQDLVQAWHRAGVAASTCRTRFALVRRVLRVAAAAGATVTPPSASGIAFPKDERLPATVKARAFTAAEARAVLEAAADPWRVAFAAALFLGLRAAEVCGLTWEAVNLASGLVQIRGQAIDGELRPLKSRSSRATLRAPAALLAILRAYREAWPPNASGFLFADARGRPLRADTLRDELHAVLERLGLPRRGLHAFRHRAAIAMSEAGVSPEALRRAMRHSSLRTTSVYLEAAPEDIAAALEQAAIAAEVRP